MSIILQKILSAFIDKKRIIGWISAVLLVVGAVVSSMSTQEFKDAVCAAPVIQAPALNAPQAPEVK